MRACPARIPTMACRSTQEELPPSTARPQDPPRLQPHQSPIRRRSCWGHCRLLWPAAAATTPPGVHAFPGGLACASRVGNGRMGNPGHSGSGPLGRSCSVGTHPLRGAWNPPRGDPAAMRHQPLGAPLLHAVSPLQPRPQAPAQSWATPCLLPLWNLRSGNHLLLQSDFPPPRRPMGPAKQLDGLICRWAASRSLHGCPGRRVSAWRGRRTCSQRRS
mmetsp:Transcript_123461/g.348891  ORF Transcript_123461/g.348891 Transcript_123461/m.348891 type:complete len:217 (-) Transcript_123461:987-1637(-)